MKKLKEKRMLIISIIATLFIPALYAFSFVDAFADPYEKLNDVSVAIVNNDEEVTCNGETLNVGSEFVNSLKDSDKFDWNFVSSKEATKGMENNEYYFTVEVPEDFSANICSTVTGDSKEATLIYKKNDNNNYISGVLGGALMSELKATLNQKVASQFLVTLGDELSNVNDLQDGTSELLSGSKDLSSGLNELNDGVSELNDNAKLLNENTIKLNSGLEELNSGYEEFNNGLISANGSLNTLTSYYSSLSTSMTNYGLLLNSIISSSDISTSDQQTLLTSYYTLSGTLSSLNSNLNSLKTGVNTLTTNSNTIYEGINESYNGSSLISSYLSKLSDGTNELYNGSTSLYNGSLELKNGISELNDGVVIMSDKLDDLNISSNADNISSAVSEVEDNYSEVKNYGYGFAPYFVSLGLFVGALISTIVVSAKKESSNEKHTAKSILKHILTFAAIVVAQVFILDSVLLLTQIHIDNVMGFVLYTLLISVAFMSLIQMLATLFGDPGRYVCIILLILQLTSCGGTFPIETSPAFFQSMHNFMPMTYTVDGLRIIIGNGNVSILNNSIIVLLGISLVSYLIIFIYFKNSKKFS